MGSEDPSLQADEFVIRPATEDDGPQLISLELETPIVVGEDKIVYDRTPDYFSFARLMERCDTVVAEEDDELIAVHSAAFPHGVLNGEEVRLNYIHHLRIRPGAQGKRLVPQLKAVAVPRYPPGQSGSYAYVDVRNQAVLSKMRGSFDTWDAKPMLMEIDIAAFLLTRTVKSRPARQAQPADSSDIAGILGGTHGHKQLWSHPTADDVAAKLGRSPSDYSWSDLLMNDDAIVGIWRAGRALEVRTTRPDGVTSRRPVVLADYGYTPGAEDAFLALLRTGLDECRADGMTSLSFFATDRCKTADVLRPYADSVRTFEFVAARLPQPPGAQDLYVDPIYF